MRKKTVLVLLFFSAAFLWLAAVNTQGYYEQGPPAKTSLGESAGAETDYMELSKNLEKTNREILRKLDQALRNQENMLKELEIVKIRASRR